MSRLKRGDKFVRGYLIDPTHQSKALAGELDRTLYAIHYNTGIIVNYLLGDISKSQFKKSLLPV
jgi:hypothetical protein